MASTLNNDPSSDIQNYIAQLEKDQQEMNAINQAFQDIIAQFLAMVKGGKDPAIALNFFFNHVMPESMSRSEGILSIAADQLNVMSGFRAAIAGIQNDFNKFGSDDTKPEDEKNYQEMLKEIQAALQFLDQDTGFDSSTTDQMKSSFNDMLKLLKDAGSGAELRKWWVQSRTPGGSKYSDLLKQFSDDGNTLNQSVSTVGQAAQTNIQYETNFYQQLMGFLNQGFQNTHKMYEATIQNQKSS